MGFLAKALLVLLVLAIAGLMYVAKLAVLYIGTDILNVGWRLFRQGIQPQFIDQATPTDHSHAFCSQDPSSSAGSPSGLTYRSGTSNSLSQSRQEEKCCSLQVSALSRVPLEVFSLVRDTCVYVSDKLPRYTYISSQGLAEFLEITGNKVVVAIHEATLFLHLDSNGSPRWLNLLEVTA